jgi:hypothetical protein
MSNLCIVFEEGLDLKERIQKRDQMCASPMHWTASSPLRKIYGRDSICHPGMVAIHLHEKADMLSSSDNWILLHLPTLPPSPFVLAFLQPHMHKHLL